MIQIIEMFNIQKRNTIGMLNSSYRRLRQSTQLRKQLNLKRGKRTYEGFRALPDRDRIERID